MYGEMFTSLGVIFKRHCLSKTAKFLHGKSANELKHSLKNVAFLNHCYTKSIQYIRLIFIGRVNRTMTYIELYSGLIYF